MNSLQTSSGDKLQSDAESASGTKEKFPVELLLPVQNFKALRAASDYADAVYFGIETLNMRMHADNFPRAELPRIAEFCHSHDMKAYLTTNIIIYENELEYLEEIIGEAKDAGIDAVIVHDMAAVEVARDIGIPFHCSTQMSISNSRAARFFESLGAERIILARELSLGMIKEIASKLTKTEIEIFVHGAQCTSVSGRCYFSAYSREDPTFSANRGRCLQPCRTKWKLTRADGMEIIYDEGFFLNSKDLCMIEYIPELIATGAKSFKIEGRMRDPYYIHTVGKCYREAISSYYNGTYTREKIDRWLEKLKSVYNRGFSTGFYFGRPSSEDIALDGAGNRATHRKVQIGKVINYYRNAMVAKIRMHDGILHIGDEIIIEGGGKMGSFLNQKITSMKINREEVTETPAATTERPVVFSIKVNRPVKKGDWVYRYIKR